MKFLTVVFLFLGTGCTLMNSKRDPDVSSVEHSMKVYTTCMADSARKFSQLNVSTYQIADAAQADCRSEYNTYENESVSYYRQLTYDQTAAYYHAVESANNTETTTKEMVMKIALERRLEDKDKVVEVPSKTRDLSSCRDECKKFNADRALKKGMTIAQCVQTLCS